MLRKFLTILSIAFLFLSASTAFGQMSDFNKTIHLDSVKTFPPTKMDCSMVDPFDYIDDVEQIDRTPYAIDLVRAYGGCLTTTYQVDFIVVQTQILSVNGVPADKFSTTIDGNRVILTALQPIVTFDFTVVVVGYRNGT